MERGLRIADGKARGVEVWRDPRYLKHAYGYV